MSNPWEDLEWRDANVPQAPLPPDLRSRLDLPETLQSVQSPHAVQRSVFDPALKHHSNAYRAADPVFGAPALDLAWRTARRQALDLVLDALAGTPWADGLVLRGSVLLRAWYGDAAREPGDLDFVVTPTERRIEEPWTRAMLTGIAAAVQESAESAGSGASGPSFAAEDAVDEDIWTYSRVPGRRLVLPWTIPSRPELAGGIVQMDFVFNEHLPTAPEPVRIPRSDDTGPGPVLQAVTPELSLAWKLMWLVSDAYPQGKDLYDAVLLAEHTPLRYTVLREAFRDAGPMEALRPLDVVDIANLATDVDWDDFVADHPHLAVDDADLIARLSAAVARTLASSEQPDDTRYTRHVRWLEPRTAQYRTLFTAAGMEAVHAQMRTDGLDARPAVIITRELLGPADHTIDEARALLLAAPAWSSWIRQFERHPEWLSW